MCSTCYRRKYRADNPERTKAATKRGNAARAKKPNVTIPTCHPTKRYGGDGLCKTCYVNKWRKDNPDKQKNIRETSGKTWHQNNRAYLREFWRIKYHKMTPRQKRLYMIWKSYGVSAKQFAKMLREQKSCCAICEKKFTWKQLFVDHDHAKGKRKGVRGLLCNACNTFLGKIEKHPKLIIKSLQYLKLSGTTLHLAIQGG